MLDLDDTIAAIATAAGAAGLAVVRMSGPRALAVADAVFEGASPLARAAGDTLQHGWALTPAAAGGARARLDEVVAAVFRAPRSYTRQDVVELSCHGGAVSAGRVLAALLAAGARQARPGEFTLRAFLNGRLDLVQAEAVADLIRAETEAAHDLALAQLRGGLSRRLAALVEAVSDALAEVEARVDFAEDVGGVEVPPRVVAAVAAAEAELADLLAGADYARAVREGVTVVLAGRPNVGKSSLVNALFKRRVSIVDAMPGVTRDRVTAEVADVDRTFELIDTGGIEVAKEDPFAESITAQAMNAAEEADVIIVLVDGAIGFDQARQFGVERIERRAGRAGGDRLHQVFAGGWHPVAAGKSRHLPFSEVSAAVRSAAGRARTGRGRRGGRPW